MDPERSPSTDDFDLLYMLGRHGWSRLLVFASDREITIGITHAFDDPITSMVEFTRSLVSGAAQATLVLLDEPGVTVVVASVDPHQRHIVELSFWNCPGLKDRPPNGQEFLKVRVRMRQIVGLFYRQLEKVRWLLEEKSYRQDRDPFPNAAFEGLRNVIVAADRRPISSRDLGLPGSL